MVTPVRPVTVIRFGEFSAELPTRRLFKRGVRVPLREKSFELLVALLERPGEVVTREELRRRLWPEGVFVDFENNLNTVAARLREALHEPAGRPRFIETVPRRGYRFTGTVAEPAGEREGGRIRLIVLPFLNLTGDPAQEYLSDSMTEELIAELAAAAPGRLAVIARTTAMCYKGATQDIARIARSLAVDYAVESSLRRSGGRARLIVQLIRTSDQEHVWSQSYEAADEGLLAVKAAAAADVARALGIRGPEKKGPASRDPVAYQRYLQGRYELNKWTREGLDRARPQFEESVERDPEFALAHDSLAELHWWEGFLGLTSPKEAFSKGVWPAMRALEIDSGLAETHALLGMYRKEISYDWREVEREMAKALELNPASPVVRFRYALSGLMPSGRVREAAQELERVLELDPLSVNVRMWLAEMLHFARENGRALEQARIVVEMDAGFWWGHMALGQILLALGRLEEGLGALRQAASLSGGHPIILGWLGMALGIAGEEREARAMLEGLESARGRVYIPPTSLAWIHLGLGETDEAFAWMDRAADERDPILIPLKNYWFFDPLREHPRYRALLRRLNLA